MSVSIFLSLALIVCGSAEETATSWRVDAKWGARRVRSGQLAGSAQKAGRASICSIDCSTVALMDAPRAEGALRGA